MLVLFGLVAFWLWVGAMPSGPFAGSIRILDFTTKTTVIYGAAVIVAAAVPPLAANLIGLKPSEAPIDAR